jgi:Mg2+-importing ATPase
VGISVSGAADVAKDAADIILLERGLEVLHRGIVEGRKAFGNVLKCILMGTSSNSRQHVQHGGGIAVPPVPAHAANPDIAQQFSL